MYSIIVCWLELAAVLVGPCSRSHGSTLASEAYDASFLSLPLCKAWAMQE